MKGSEELETTNEKIKVQIQLPKDVFEKYKAEELRTGIKLNTLIALDIVNKANERILIDSLPDMLKHIKDGHEPPK